MSREDIWLEDPTVGVALHAWEEGKKPQLDFLKGQSLEVRQLVQRLEKLQVVDGILWRQFVGEEAGGN